MAAEQEQTQPIIYRIDKNFSYNFDVLQNMKVSNRKSDTGFSDENKFMISMRDGTTQLGNNITGGTGGGSKMYFFTDFLGKRHCVRGYNNRVYWLNTSNQWIDITGSMTGNNFNFNTVKLPLMLNGSNPTEYTTPADATGSELVKKDAADTGGASNVGKVIFITDNDGDKDVYRGCFGFITAYDSTTSEYIIGDSGIFGSFAADFETVIGLKSGSKYKIFDTIGEFLQISNGVSLEKYFFGKSDGTLEEFTNFQGLATYGLRNIVALTSSQYLKKQIYWNNAYYTWNKGTLFYSSGNVNNPFFYTFTNAISIPGINGGTIQDIFIFKDRLVIAGNNFIAYINKFTDIVEVKRVVGSYGMKENSLIDLGVDSYFISSNRQIYSLAEEISGTLIATNVGQKVNNYVKDFFTNICSGFDGRKLYFYGQIDSNTAGVMVVLDIEYKFWSIYTGLRPSSIINEDGVIYMTDNNSHIVRFFDSTTTKDVGNINIEQKIAFNEFYGATPFIGKTVSDFYLWLENYEQEFYVDIYLANPQGNGRKARKEISLIETDVTSGSSGMGEGILGEGILGGNGYEAEIAFPYMKHIVFDSDQANIWKIVITGKDGSPFYLNEAMLEYKQNESGSYFSPINTI